MNYKIVPMDRSHLAGVAELERQCFSTPWTEAMLAEELYSETASFLVAEDETGAVCGYAGLHVILDEGYIDNVAVAETKRRQGLAKRLCEVYCRFASENLQFLTLEVRASNAPAIALYEGLGFREVGRRPDYYTKPKEDALLLTRHFREEADA